MELRVGDKVTEEHWSPRGTWRMVYRVERFDPAPAGCDVRHTVVLGFQEAWYRQGERTAA